MAGQNNSDYQTYYVPEQSSMAILTASSMALLVIGVASGMNSMTFGDGSGSWFLFFAGLIMLLGTLAVWFTTTIKENLKGMNSEQLKRSYRIGMQWFIFSEVMFFAGFFGALFYVRQFAGPWLSGELESSILWGGFTFDWPLLTTPQDALGGVDAQMKLGRVANNGVFTGAHESMAFPGWGELTHWLPFWNTLFLVTSSVTLEFSHHALKANKRSAMNLWLAATLALAVLFVCCQYKEYHEAFVDYGLTLKSGIYGSTFFILTGFHGFHVCMGAIMLLVQFIRSVKGKHFTPEDHFGFEASSWYWHFVDVVWLFLMLVVYLY